MRGWVGLAIVASIAGCDTLWSVDRVELRDAHIADSPADARARDFDKDGVANDSDDCPSAFDPDQQDGDGDHVGDACDPHPTTPTDRIVDYAFIDDGLAEIWPPDAAGWTVTDDGLLSPPPAPGARLLTHVAVDLFRPTLVLGFTLVIPGQAGAGSYVGVKLPHYVQDAECWTTEDTPDTESTIWSGYTTGGAFYSTGYSPELVTGSHYVMKLSRDIPDFTCTVGAGSMTVPNETVDHDIGAPFIEVEKMQVKIDSVVLYSL